MEGYCVTNFDCYLYNYNTEKKTITGYSFQELSSLFFYRGMKGGLGCQSYGKAVPFQTDIFGKGKDLSNAHSQSQHNGKVRRTRQVLMSDNDVSLDPLSQLKRMLFPRHLLLAADLPIQPFPAKYIGQNQYCQT